MPDDGTGGGTWSKNAPFSSKITKSTVEAQTSGFDTSVSRMVWTRFSPYSGGAAGYSHCAMAGRSS
ncbi:MAG TPA: hypothetical protein VMD28_04375 [Acidimicrobiales bacterium]|nr:hypothetical protein [Acidimicrobiales bacterium]